MDALMTSPKLLFSLTVLTILLSISSPSCSFVEHDHGIDLLIYLFISNSHMISICNVDV